MTKGKGEVIAQNKQYGEAVGGFSPTNEYFPFNTDASGNLITVGGGGGGVTDVNIKTIDGTIPAIEVANANLNVQLDHDSATPDSVQIGDGTDTLAINTDGSINSTTAGKNSVALVANDCSSVNITTAAYVQLIASTSADINYLDIFNSSGSQIYIAVGAVASEVDQIIVVPSGGEFNLYIPSGSRVSAKALDANATIGYLTITALS